MAIIFVIVEFGSITENNVSLYMYHSYDPPRFNLMGKTAGGPPERYLWSRNGVPIADRNSSYNYFIYLEPLPNKFTHSIYTSVLNVSGSLPGIYNYSVFNRNMMDWSNDSVTVRGNVLQ